MLAVLFCFCLGLFGGFFYGRRRGMATGFAQGAADARLAARQESYEQGRCVLCGAPAREEAQEYRQEAAARA